MTTTNHILYKIRALLDEAGSAAIPVAEAPQFLGELATLVSVLDDKLSTGHPLPGAWVAGRTDSFGLGGE